MLTTLINLLLALMTTDADAEALRRTAPEPITLAAARENLIGARIAGALTDIDPDLLLAIGWHESNYTSNYVQPEPPDPHDPEQRPRVSCGVMTPYPFVGTCPTSATLAEQYLDGAVHLRQWMERTTMPILGYAGIAGSCSAGPVIRRGHDLCGYEREMRDRAELIRCARVNGTACILWIATTAKG
jgi:hypothetical protein